MGPPAEHGWSAIVLAGGRARRMGGLNKPTLTVGDKTLLTRVLLAVDAADPRVVVGPAELTPHLTANTWLTCEQPSGSGPVAATAAGLGLLAPIDGDSLVALFACDLPFLTPATVARLCRAASDRDVSGAVAVDDDGRPQWLCGVWRLDDVRRALVALADPAGKGMRDLLAGLARRELARRDLASPELDEAAPGAPPVWLDCDTEDDLLTARRWLSSPAAEAALPADPTREEHRGRIE